MFRAYLKFKKVARWMPIMRRPDASAQKQELRQRLLSSRASLSKKRRLHLSRAILRSLGEELRRHQVACVLAYRSAGSEVDTSALHHADFPLPVYAPICLSDGGMRWRNGQRASWAPAAHGLLEPTTGEYWQAGEGETWLVCPLLGFDRLGQRLGMGAGYFDRWLARHGEHVGMRVGLAFSLQEVNRLPCEAHDQPLHMVITEKEVIHCPKP